MSYDLKIVNATIVDGTETAAFPGSVGILGERIVALGDAPDDAVRTIDAEGRIVCPGFIDAHTHLDAQALFDPMLSISSWHGVTTVVGGNCGFGIAPIRTELQDLMMHSLESVEGMNYDCLLEGLGKDWGFETFGEYLSAVETRGVGINLAAYVGHTPVRLCVMGPEATERAATTDEIARMKVLVREALDSGAIGFSTSKTPSHIVWEGRPAPSRLAEWEEILALGGVLGEAGKGLFMGSLGPGLSMNEFMALNETTGRPVTFGAILTDMGGVGRHRRMLERLDAARADGHAIVAQVSSRPVMADYSLESPYMISQGAPAVMGLPTLQDLFAPIFQAETVAEKMAVYRNAGFREKFRRQTDGDRWDTTLWANMVVLDAPDRPELEHRKVVDLAAERGLHPAECLLDLALDTELRARFAMAYVNTDRAEIEVLLKNPGTQIGLSDSGAHINEICDAVYTSDFLGTWVRERGVFSTETAIAMLTSRPADLFGFTDRGRLAEGKIADLVIFDPDQVAAGPPRRVHDLPAGSPRLVADAIGIDSVIVSGVVVRHGNEDTLDPKRDRLPGRVLRS